MYFSLSHYISDSRGLLSCPRTDGKQIFHLQNYLSQEMRRTFCRRASGSKRSQVLLSPTVPIFHLLWEAGYVHTVAQLWSWTWVIGTVDQRGLPGSHSWVRTIGNDFAVFGSDCEPHNHIPLNPNCITDSTYPKLYTYSWSPQCHLVWEEKW